MDEEQIKKQEEGLEYLPEREEGLTPDLEKKFRKLKEELAECKKESQDYLTGWQRARADFINYKKDEARRDEELKSWLIKTYVLTLLPIIDDFEKALSHLPKEQEGSDWIKGIFQIYDKFKAILKELGLEEIKTLGEKFNPEFHEAVEMLDSDKEEGIIVEELQKGYILAGQVIRPAKVKVSKGRN